MRECTFPASIRRIMSMALCAQVLSRVRLFVTPRTVARQAPLSMGFSMQGYWSGFPSPGIELVSLALADDSLLLSHQGSPGIMSIILAILHIFFLPLFILFLCSFNFYLFIYF